MASLFHVALCLSWPMLCCAGLVFQRGPGGAASAGAIPHVFMTHCASVALTGRVRRLGGFAVVRPVATPRGNRACAIPPHALGLRSGGAAVTRSPHKHRVHGPGRRALRLPSGSGGEAAQASRALPALAGFPGRGSRAPAPSKRPCVDPVDFFPGYQCPGGSRVFGAIPPA